MEGKEVVRKVVAKRIVGRTVVESLREGGNGGSEINGGNRSGNQRDRELDGLGRR